MWGRTRSQAPNASIPLGSAKRSWSGIACPNILSQNGSLQPSRAGLIDGHKLDRGNRLIPARSATRRMVNAVPGGLCGEFFTMRSMLQGKYSPGAPMLQNSSPRPIPIAAVEPEPQVAQKVLQSLVDGRHVIEME